MFTRKKRRVVVERKRKKAGLPTKESSPEQSPRTLMTKFGASFSFFESFGFLPTSAYIVSEQISFRKPKSGEDLIDVFGSRH